MDYGRGWALDSQMKLEKWMEFCLAPPLRLLSIFESNSWKSEATHGRRSSWTSVRCPFEHSSDDADARNYATGEITLLSGPNGRRNCE